jgi:hypothetical protein
VTLALLLVGVSCGTSTLTAATPSPSPSAVSSPTAVAVASPTPAPPPDYGPPPAGVDLLYVAWPAAPTWLIGYDWHGQPRATVHLKELDGQADQIGSGITVAPNGNGFLSGGYTFDRLGRVSYQSAPPGKGNLNRTWSEDGQLICGVEEVNSTIDSNGNGTSDYYLVRRTPNGPPVRVRRFLHLDAVPGDLGFGMYACSHWLDRALIVKTVCCGIQGATVMRLSDGAILGTWNRDAGSPIFSPDGQEVADPTWTPDGKTVSTAIKTLLGGTVLARYGAGISFQAFAANNRYAVVTTPAGQTQVIEVSTRRVVWRDSQDRKLSRIWARPGAAGDVALIFTAPPVQMPCPGDTSSQCPNPESSIVMVHADGSSVDLGGEFIVPLSWG